jgi:hypothetical protein
LAAEEDRKKTLTQPSPAKAGEGFTVARMADASLDKLEQKEYTIIRRNVAAARLFLPVHPPISHRRAPSEERDG